MTDKENRVKQCELNLRMSEIKFREAKSALDHGYAKAKAELEKEYDKLKLDLEKAEVEMERDKAYLETANADLARGFDS